MGNYTPNPSMTQPIYDPTRPFATPSHHQTMISVDDKMEMLADKMAKVLNNPCH